MPPDDQKPALNVVEAPFPNYRDVASMMAGVVHEVHSGRLGAIKAGACVLLNEAGDPTVFAWGATEGLHTIGLLHVGAAHLAAGKFKR